METLKEIITKRLKEKGISAKKMCEDIEITEQALYSMFRNNSGSRKTLKKINDYLSLDLNKNFSDSTSENSDSMIIDYLRKENEFLKGFIKEKLAINFNQGVLLTKAYDPFFLTNLGHKVTHP